MSKRAAVCFLVMVWSALYLGQGTARIAGVVLNAETGLPLSGVRTELTGANVTLQTGEDGFFSFSGLRPGRYRVVPALAGYVQAHAASVKSPREAGAWVQVSTNEEHIELRMEREAILTGRVVDGKGKPLSGLLPNLLRYRYDEFGNRGLSAIPGSPTSGSAFSRPKTDDRGEFRIYGMQPGEYYVHVPGAYYPGTRDSARATPVNLKSGENPPITLVVPDQSEAPPRTSVKLRLNGEIPDTMAAEVQTGNTGFIVFGPFTKEVLLPNFRSGQFDVFIRWRNSSFTDLIYSRFSVDTLGGEVLLQDVSVDRGVTVKGQLTLQKEGLDTLSLENVRCRLRSSVVGSVQEQPGIRCLGGQYALGDYQLEMESLPADAYVASVTQEGSTRNLVSGGIEIRQETKLEILVTAPGSSVEGNIRDSKGELLEGATVVAVPAEPFRSSWVLYRSVISDVKGRFQLRGIAPGNYNLFVWSNIEGPAFRNAEFLKSYEDRATRIQVAKANRIRMDLTSF